jgi:hypothetical protein
MKEGVMQAAVINRTGCSRQSLWSRVELAVAMGVAVAGVGIGVLIAAPSSAYERTVVDTAAVPVAERVPGPSAYEGER